MEKYIAIIIGLSATCTCIFILALRRKSDIKNDMEANAPSKNMEAAALDANAPSKNDMEANLLDFNASDTPSTPVVIPYPLLSALRKLRGAVKVLPSNDQPPQTPPSTPDLDVEFELLLSRFSVPEYWYNGGRKAENDGVGDIGSRPDSEVILPGQWLKGSVE